MAFGITFQLLGKHPWSRLDQLAVEAAGEELGQMAAQPIRCSEEEDRCCACVAEYRAKGDVRQGALQ